MKFKLLETINTDKQMIEDDPSSELCLRIYEVINKPYLLVRVYYNGYKGQFFSSPERWGYKLESLLKKWEEG